MIKYHKNFKKKFKKIPSKIKDKFFERLNIFLKNPYDLTLNHHTLHGDFVPFHSFNITGDWRVIFEYKNDFIVLHDIGTHAQLYK